jgi:hypothetical protein
LYSLFPQAGAVPPESGKCSFLGREHAPAVGFLTVSELLLSFGPLRLQISNDTDCAVCSFFDCLHVSVEVALIVSAELFFSGKARFQISNVTVSPHALPILPAFAFNSFSYTKKNFSFPGKPYFSVYTLLRLKMGKMGNFI